MSETATPAVSGADSRSRASRWLKGGMIASLALNFLLIGLLAGGAWVNRRFDGVSSPAINAARYVRQLPGERRTAIREAMRVEIDKMRALRGEVRAAREAARVLLGVEPFDKPGYAAAQQRLVESEMRLRQHGAHLLIETVGMMTPQERKGLSQFEGRRDRHGGGRKRGGDGDDQGRQSERPRQP